MKSLLKICFLILLFANSLFANPFTEPLEKVHALLEDDITKAIAGILIALCGFYVSSGQFDKGKGYAWGLIIGISLVYGSKWIADFIWG
jgi:type IV secretory pathway VirB2 component (pilin)